MYISSYNLQVIVKSSKNFSLIKVTLLLIPRKITQFLKAIKGTFVFQCLQLNKLS